MYKIYFTGLLFVLFTACGQQKEDNSALSIDIANTEEFAEAANSFASGAATTAQEYFSGLLAVVIEADIKLREVKRLDEEDAAENQIKLTIDEMIENVGKGKKAIGVYKDKDWPLKNAFHDLTMEWFESIENLGYDYLYNLAGPMSRVDETWSDEEFALYEDYSVAYEDYTEIDNRWIQFQYTYAEANGFELGDVLDLESVVEEEVNNAI